MTQVTVNCTTKKAHVRDHYDNVDVSADPDSGALEISTGDRTIVYESDEWFSYTVQNSHYIPSTQTMTVRKPEHTLPESIYLT